MEKLNKILTVAIVVVIVMLGFQSVKFAKNWKENRQTKQEFEFQILSNTNFANVDPNMPEEVLKSQKEKYNQAMEKLKELGGCDVHLTHIPAPGDEAGLRRLGLNITSDPAFPSRDLFSA